MSKDKGADDQQGGDAGGDKDARADRRKITELHEGLPGYFEPPTKGGGKD